MAIRSRLKSLVKQMIFGSPSGSSQPSYTPPVTPAPTFSQKPVSTQATVDPAPPAEPVTEPPVIETATTTDTSDEPRVDAGVDTGEEVHKGEAISIDDSEASYIFDVVDLFPSNCPSCDASSQNNWIRIENKFACGSCEEPYAA